MKIFLTISAIVLGSITTGHAATCGEAFWSETGQVCLTYCGTMECTIDNATDQATCVGTTGQDGATIKCNPVTPGQPWPKTCKAGGVDMTCNLAETPD